ncbi:MAG: CapA family protein [Hyphomonadaceae bacterium]|nr:CapA family protein [Hyphomonadaceae bacterium]
MSRELLLLAVGDVAADRPDPRRCFDHVRARVREADVAFCQLEVNLTTRGVRLPQARHTMRGDPAIAAAIRDAGFHVVSFAGNHCMDWGMEAFQDTIDNLQEAELQVVGVGANIAAARQPVFVERDGVRIAFLAYSTILPMGYWAEASRPGCAPMRAFTIYEQIEHDQPGTPARIHTYPQRDDLKALVSDVRQARAQADFVAVSLHWGIHFVPAVLADYQRDVAYAAIDAGADAILGHHAHILKGVEIYKDRPIFYSLANFAVDLRMDKAHAESKSFKEIQALSPDWVPDFDSLYNFPPASRMSIAAELVLHEGGLRDVAIRPLYINSSAQPEIMQPEDPRFEQIRAYLEDISAQADLQTRFKQRGDLIALEAA